MTKYPHRNLGNASKKARNTYHEHLERVDTCPSFFDRAAYLLHLVGDCVVPIRYCHMKTIITTNFWISPISPLPISLHHVLS